MDRAPDLLDDLLRRATAGGADAADALLVESGALAVTQRLGKLEKVERAESHDLGLRVFVGQRQAIVSTGELDAASLDGLVEHALGIARAVPEDRYAGLAAPEQIATRLPTLDLDDGVERDAEALALRAAAAEDAARAYPASATPRAPRPAGRARARPWQPPTAFAARPHARATASASP